MVSTGLPELRPLLFFSLIFFFLFYLSSLVFLSFFEVNLPPTLFG